MALRAREARRVGAPVVRRQPTRARPPTTWASTGVWRAVLKAAQRRTATTSAQLPPAAPAARRRAVPGPTPWRPTAAGSAAWRPAGPAMRWVVRGPAVGEPAGRRPTVPVPGMRRWPEVGSGTVLVRLV